ncbi:kinase-like domain-containing protein [Gigaspora rosea]|uniref:Kinase-like domain-containing protein n=1 Tax=Gigaspora rosea TaxID=44941 RepID=A0A397TRQ9_9GLOM|nr:kinase-like domain-containing protein [Gigaspora rosea]
MRNNGLHSGNILQDELDNAYITDLGLINTNNEVCGILPYMAPEVLQRNPYTKAADISALGIIMTEISTGRKAFDGYNFDNELALKICHGLQPKFTSCTPEC